MHVRSLLWLAAAAVTAATACADSRSGSVTTAGDVASAPDAQLTDSGAPPPDRYAFESRFEAGVDSVRLAEPRAHLVLLQDLAAHIASWEREPTGSASSRDLGYYYDLDPALRGDDSLGLTTTPPTEQGSRGAFDERRPPAALIAGSEPEEEHRPWATELVAFASGFLAKTPAGPDGLIRAILGDIEARRAGGELSPLDGVTSLPPWVRADGLDLRALVDGLLHGLVAFQRAADHLIDDCTSPAPAALGLCADNEEPLPGEPFTALERAWDQAFGYFGASVHYATFSARQLNFGPRFADDDGDGRIDLTREYNLGAAVLAGRRDHDSSPTARTGLMGSAWDGFLAGRALITRTAGALGSAEMALLQRHRDNAMAAWAGAIAATLVSDLNTCLGMFEDFGEPGFAYEHDDLLDHAAAFAAMKAAAISLQVDPRSPMTRDQQIELIALAGDHPLLPLPSADAGSVEARRQELVKARALVAAAFGFAAANLGDEHGDGGW